MGYFFCCCLADGLIDWLRSCVVKNSESVKRYGALEDNLDPVYTTKVCG
jgi:hypothetical protein